MDKSLNIYDIVQWQEPGGEKHLWMVSLWAKGPAGITLTPDVVDARSEACKSDSPDNFTRWVMLTKVGSQGRAAVDVDRIYNEGSVLSHADDYDDDDDEGGFDDDEDDDVNEW